MDKLKDKGEIYMVINIINNKRYIGQAICWTGKNKEKRHGSEQRWRKHVWSALNNENRCPALSNAIRKYNPENFKVVPLWICDVSQMNYYEQKFTRLYNTITPNGYNIRMVSSKGKHNSESVKKISIAKSGINNHMYGKHHSEETKKKMGEAISYARKKGNLPQYVYQFKEGYYLKHHPKLDGKRKMFYSRSQETMEETLQRTMNSLANLNLS